MNTSKTHPSRKKRPRKVLHTNLRMLPEERNTLARAALADGRSMHNFILRAALEAARAKLTADAA